MTERLSLSFEKSIGEAVRRQGGGGCVMAESRKETLLMETEPHFLRKLRRGPPHLAAQTTDMTSGCQDGHPCWDVRNDTVNRFSPIRLPSGHCPSGSTTRVCAWGSLGMRSCEHWDLEMLGQEERKCLVWGDLCCAVYAQSCLTLCDPMGYSLPGSSIHGTFQARTLEWVAISSSRGPSQPRD